MGPGCKRESSQGPTGSDDRVYTFGRMAGSEIAMKLCQGDSVQNKEWAEEGWGGSISGGGELGFCYGLLSSLLHISPAFSEVG